MNKLKYIISDEYIVHQILEKKYTVISIIKVEKIVQKIPDFIQFVENY